MAKPRTLTLLAAVILAASLVVSCSTISLRYVLPYGVPGLGSGIWVGGGDLGYTNSVLVAKPGTEPQWREKPPGNTLGGPLKEMCLWPEWSAGVFGVEALSTPNT